MNHETFILWEAASKDTIDFKKIYVDIADDLNAGLMLSEIVFWYLPNKQGNSKLRVKRNNYEWIACHRYEWWERTRLSPKQADRAIGILVKRGLVSQNLWRFNGEVCPHIRLCWTVFLARHQEIIARPSENPFLPKGKMDITQKVKSISTKRESPLTETTTETTSEIKEKEKGTFPMSDIPAPDTREALKLEVDRMVNGVVAKLNGNMGSTRKTDAQIAAEIAVAEAKYGTKGKTHVSR
jgi:hypothetical protein